MKSNRIVLTALAAGSMVVCGTAFGDESVSSMATNATSKISSWFKGSGEDSTNMVNKLSEKLGLTDDQKQKVESAFKSEHQQVQDVKQNNTLSTGEAHSKMQEIHSSLDSKMKSILTPDQYQKWEKISHPSHIMVGSSSSTP